jgi:hypothetical protein
MEKVVKEKRKQILSVKELLVNSKISDENYDSTIEPFFQRRDINNYDMDFKKLPELPEGLNRHMKLFYSLVGNPDVEVYIGEWTFMSLNKCLEIYNDYCVNGQKSLFDIAFIYAGMGHIKLISCDLNNHLLFERPDGGSSGYDREDNYQKSLKYETGKNNYLYFTQFKGKILNTI